MNTLTIEQTSAVLNDVLAQVTGSKTIGTVTPENFVTLHPENQPEPTVYVSLISNYTL